MHTTALDFPLTVPPWQKPTSTIRVVSKAEVKRVAGAALARPQSKWTVIAAFILSILLHAGAVAIVQKEVDRPPVQMSQAVGGNSMSAPVD